MIRSMNFTDVADAFGMSETEFRVILPALKVLGFPEATSEGATYATAEVLSWVAKQQDINLSIITKLAERLQALN